MRPALLVLLLVLASVLVGCAWTMSAQRRQRISDCLARCDAMGQKEAGQRPVDPQSGFVDQRSDCERQCHSIR
jgi:hypothetical protein